MTIVFIARKSNTLKLITQRLLQFQRQFHSQHQRAIASGAFTSSRAFSSASSLQSSATSSVSTNHRKLIKKYKNLKDISVVLGSGLLFVASYISLSSHYLSDTGSSDAFRSFSTTNSNNNSSQNSKQSMFLLNEEEVTKRLRNLEESYFVNRGKGVIRYDISQLPSNSPIEDDRSESVITVASKDNEDTDLYFWGIYDGHSGPYTSARLKDHLINYVIRELSTIYKSDPSNPKLRIVPDQESIDLAIKNGFLKLDQELVQKSLEKLFEDPQKEQNVIGALPASSGSCGLLTFYDSSLNILKVAVTGDSRALLGSLNENNEWTVKSLSVDQTGDNPEEVERIQNEHPNEKNVIKNGRVLGNLQPTRAFGDFRYKLTEVKGKTFDTLPEHMTKFFFRLPPKNNLTPPYVTAEPVVSTTTINPSKNDFVVLGSDGLYELLSNEEIVGLVVKWLEKNKVGQETKSSPSTTSSSSTFSFSASSLSSSASSLSGSGSNNGGISSTSSALPNATKFLFSSSSNDKKLPKIIDLSDPKHKETQRPPFRNKKNDEQHEYLLEDDNVSTHLIRNALSLGGSKEYVSTLVSIPSPKSRRYRDDLTVTVVFFGENKNADSNAKLEINQKATKGGKFDEKPHL